MDIETRIRKLERENRWFKRLGLMLLLAVGLLATLGQAQPAPTTLQATKFVLVDEGGQVRAVLGMENGGPALVLQDTRGRAVVQLQVPKVPDKPALYLSDPQESSGVELALTMNGPVLHLMDKTGTRVRLATNELNAPLAAVYDAQGETLFQVSADK